MVGRHASKLQEKQGGSLTSAACMPDLTVQEYKGGSVCEHEFRDVVDDGGWGAGPG